MSFQMCVIFRISTPFFAAFNADCRMQQRRQMFAEVRRLVQRFSQNLADGFPASATEPERRMIHSKACTESTKYSTQRKLMMRRRSTHLSWDLLASYLGHCKIWQRTLLSMPLRSSGSQPVQLASADLRFGVSCFRIFRRYVSIRDFCVGGQCIHFAFSTRAEAMQADMQIFDRGATAIVGIQAQNAIRFLLCSYVGSVLIRSHSAHPSHFIFSRPLSTFWKTPCADCVLRFCVLRF